MRVKVFLSLFIRIIKSIEDVMKRERVKSEELQLDKVMPSRKPVQDVKQAGRKCQHTGLQPQNICSRETGQRQQEQFSKRPVPDAPPLERVTNNKKCEKEKGKKSVGVRRGYLENTVKWRWALSVCFSGIESSSSATEITGASPVDRDHMVLLSKLRRKESVMTYWKLVKAML